MRFVLDICYKNEVHASTRLAAFLFLPSRILWVSSSISHILACSAVNLWAIIMCLLQFSIREKDFPPLARERTQVVTEQ